jgi:hypothetical protein
MLVAGNEELSTFGELLSVALMMALWNGPPLSSCSVSCTGNKGLGS